MWTPWRRKKQLTLDIVEPVIWAHFAATEDGVYIENPQTGQKIVLALWERGKKPQCDETGHYYNPQAIVCYCGNTGMAAEPPKAY